MIQLLYGLLCVLGLALPYSYLIPFFVHGGHPSQMIDLVFTNSISAAFGLDVAVSFVVLVTFIQLEGWRLKMRSLWLYVLVTSLTGVSFGLPLFLLMRQRKLEQGNQQFEVSP